MISPVTYCAHDQVRWLTSHVCHCDQCGRRGTWYEDGFVLWSKKCRHDVLPTQTWTDANRPSIPPHDVAPTARRSAG